MTESAATVTNGAGDQLKAAFRAFMADPHTDIPEAVNPVQELLDEHFGTDCLTMPTAALRYNLYLEVCYQRALDEFFAEAGRDHRIFGLRLPSVADHHMGAMTFARVLSRPTFSFIPPVFCPVDYQVLPSGCETTQPCLRKGLILFNDADGPGAMWIRLNEEGFKQMVVEVMTPDLDRAEAILAQLSEAAVRLNPFKGQVLEITATLDRGPVITFLPRPRDTSRDEVILPGSMLDQIEQHSLGFVEAQESLVASGRHLKRGLLLHGRPGTGKTHTIKYLISQMPHATVAVMSAARMAHYIHVIPDVIDVVVPGVIVLDDVDLIAEDRAAAGERYALFALLGMLDGLSDDHDLLFVMTTNRPNEIEPAIAARPGRVDQAIEVPLPDAACRRRLFDLYIDGLDIQAGEDDIATFIDRTDGVTASFIREALRRAAVASLDAAAAAGANGSSGNGQTNEIVVQGEHLLGALDELLDPDNPLTPLLLGAEPKHAVPTVKL